MKLTFDWLNDYLDLSEVSGHELAERMSRTGIEIESVTNFSEGLSGLVVGHVVDLSAHPDSDHLNITKVDVGDDELLQIVCGAPNVAQGQKVIVAKVGAVLPGDFEIKSAELRGQLSQGMICSLQEIGFSENVVPKKYAKGIYVLDEDAPVGADIIDYLKLDDPILELDLTPNRADALSIMGIVYEVAAILDQKIKEPVKTEVAYHSAPELLNTISIDVDRPELSPHFTLRIIDQIEIQESPLWLQMRLMKMGMRPLNNIVDTTNYMMLLYGQPLHAYDLDKLTRGNIGVRLARPGEVLRTIDEVDRHLDEEDMVITADDQAVGLAGVMGGFDTEVTDTTQKVLLESAQFDPIAIRKTSKKYGLRSEASARNEKGINIDTIVEASQKAAELMAELGQGSVVEGFIESHQITKPDVVVEVPYSSIPEKLGIELSQEEIKNILDRLGFPAEFMSESFKVNVPHRRWDISIEADILEEIARIYGYDKIPTTLPKTSGQPGMLTSDQRFIRRTREILEGFGLNQVISYILTSQDKANLLKAEDAPFVKLALPMSEERTTLRQSMFPALLEVTQFNRARQVKQIAIYETGRVFFGRESGTLPVEEERLAIMLSGIKENKSWLSPEDKFDFYTLKGMVEGYFQAIRLEDHISYKANSTIEVMHPGRTADILFDHETIGFMGQVHPRIAETYDLPQETFFMEINLEPLIQYQRPMVSQKAISKYPSTSRDIAMLVPLAVKHADIVATIKKSASQYLQSVELFDRYQGENIDPDKQSLAYHLVFQNPEASLVDEEVNLTVENIISQLQTIEGLEIR